MQAQGSSNLGCVSGWLRRCRHRRCCPTYSSEPAIAPAVKSHALRRARQVQQRLGGIEGEGQRSVAAAIVQQAQPLPIQTRPQFQGELRLPGALAAVSPALPPGGCSESSSLSDLAAVHPRQCNKGLNHAIDSLRAG